MSFEPWIITEFRRQGREEEAAWAESYNDRIAKGLNYDNEYVVASFPNPLHNSHHLHRKLARVIGWDHRFGADGVIRAVWINGSDEGKETILHVLEFRHLKTNLHVMAAVDVL